MNPTVAPNLNGDQQYAQLKAAVLGAQSNPAPGASPLGSFPELSKLYSSGAQLDQTRLSSAAPNYNATVTADNQRAEAAAAAQKLKNLQDGSKYQQVANSDGGYKFYDPLGNEISAAQYAAVTNKSPADVLKNSQNPIDIAFAQDYKQLQSYIQDKQNSRNNTDAAARAKAIEAEVKNSYGIDLTKESPQQVIQTFKQAYPTVFGLTTTGPQGTNTFLPGSNAVKQSIDTSGAIGG